MKYYLIAGEKSGDLHGSNLIRHIALLDQEAQFRGLGGDLMESQGMTLVKHFREIAFMGFLEVLLRVFALRRALADCKQDIANYNPDVVIFIDFGGFNMRIARKLADSPIKKFYYISPKVWAWNTSRAFKLKKTIDRMFVILPFEKEFFKKFNWDVDFVGNPIVDAVYGFVPDDNFRSELGFEGGSKPLIAVLPGSRAQEVRNVLNLICQIVSNRKELNFVIAKVKSLPMEYYRQISDFSNVKIVEERTYDLLNISDTAIVTSGTATLETALFNTPQVVVYKTSWISYVIAKIVVKVPYISLVNLIAGKKVVTELIQSDYNQTKLNYELDLILPSGSGRNGVLAGYDEIRHSLGDSSPSQTCAELMVKYLRTP